MRKLISFILLILVFWGTWHLYNKQAQSKKGGIVNIGITLPLSGKNAETGLAAQDAMNLALKEWKNRKTSYQYRLFYQDDSGDPEKAGKNLSNLIEKQNAAAIITLWTPAAQKAIPLADKFRRIHFTCAIGNDLSDGRYNFNHYLSYHTDKFTETFFNTTGKIPASCSSNLYDALNLLIFTYENTSPAWGDSLPSAERISRNLHKLSNHTTASGQIFISPRGEVLQAEE